MTAVDTRRPARPAGGRSLRLATAARDGDATVLRARLRQFGALTAALWTVR